MNRDDMLDLAHQFRTNINYTGTLRDVENFDSTVIDLIKTVESQCAQVVEQTPTQLFIISSPQSILGLIASAVRGEI